MFSWKNKKVLVTGSEGMIGKELVKLLLDLGAKVDITDIKFRNNPKLRRRFDITYKGVAEEIFESKLGPFNYVFHLAGIKGNPKMTNERPVDFMGPMLQFDTNMILAAQKYKVKRFLYTSSIAVENPKSDKYPAWAKKTAETLIEAMRIQYPKGTKYTIVRPANVYGIESLDREHLMVVSDLVKKGLSGPVKIWDDGQSVRDIINARDVARGMIRAMEELPDKPVNLCSGRGVKILDIAKEIAKNLKEDLITGPKTKPTRRVMKNPYIKPEVTLQDGIKEICDYWLSKKE